ncbi:MAG: ABC transporter permease [Acidimicrobiales bacterium]|nr:ABC transporter permease [Acidimicrobiales bacterium]
MIVVLVILAVLVALATWIVRVAGWRFAVQRLGGALLILLLVTFITSFLLRFVGVDAEQKAALRELGVSENAQPCVSALGTGATVEAVNACVDERGLDENAFVQYWGWAKDVLRGDLGPAFYKSGDAEPLTGTIEQRMPRTAWLFLYSQIIALAIAVPLGIWSAYQAGRVPRPIPKIVYPIAVVALLAISVFAGWTLAAALLVGILVPTAVFHGLRGGPGGDTAVNLFAFVLLSVPAFVLGESLRFVFSVQRGWYPLTGYAPWSEGVGAHLKSVWLPALVLGLAATPVYLRLLRADMRQNLQQDFVAVAKAKGMSNTHILLRHVLRPSTVTLLTVAGLNIAQLVNGAIVVEFIYDFDGMGSYLLEAVARREFFAVQTLVALVAVVFVVANTIVDLLYTIVDPRVRAQAPA